MIHTYPEGVVEETFFDRLEQAYTLGTQIQTQDKIIESFQYSFFDSEEADKLNINPDDTFSELSDRAKAEVERFEKLQEEMDALIVITRGLFIGRLVTVLALDHNQPNLPIKSLRYSYRPICSVRGIITDLNLSSAFKKESISMKVEAGKKFRINNQYHIDVYNDQDDHPPAIKVEFHRSAIELPNQFIKQ